MLQGKRPRPPSPISSSSPLVLGSAHPNQRARATPVQQVHTMVFPTAPPRVQLSYEEATAPYALENPPPRFKAEIKKYETWCGDPINTERSTRYIKAVQSTSLEKTQSLVLGFAGIISNHYALSRDEISLDIYSNPTYVARFIGYLQVIKTVCLIYWFRLCVGCLGSIPTHHTIINMPL